MNPQTDSDQITWTPDETTPQGRGKHLDGVYVREPGKLILDATERGQHERPPIVRIKNPEPRSKDAIAADVSSAAEALQAALDKYAATAGTNPNQEAILTIKAQISQLELQLRPLQHELARLEAEPLPTEKVLRELKTATESVHQLSHEATEAEIKHIAKTRYDISHVRALSSSTLREIKATDRLLSIRDITLQFWVRYITPKPAIENFKTAAEHVFSACERLVTFLSQ